MPEAVIVSTARSPIGRAMKGSLIDMRPDDLATQMVRAALDKVRRDAGELVPPFQSTVGLDHCVEQILHD